LVVYRELEFPILGEKVSGIPITRSCVIGCKPMPDTQSTLKRTGERARGLASTRFSAFPISAAGLQPAANARGSLREYQFPQLALNCV